MDEKLREAIKAKNDLGDALDGTLDGKDHPVFLAFCRLENALNALRATPQAVPVSVPSVMDITENRGKILSILLNMKPNLESANEATGEVIATVNALLTAHPVTPTPETVSRARDTGLRTADDRQVIHEGDLVEMHQFDREGGDIMPSAQGILEYNDESACFGLRLTRLAGGMIYDSWSVGDWCPIINVYGLHEESFTIIEKCKALAELGE